MMLFEGIVKVEMEALVDVDADTQEEAEETIKEMFRVDREYWDKSDMLASQMKCLHFSPCGPLEFYFKEEETEVMGIEDGWTTSRTDAEAD